MKKSLLLIFVLLLGVWGWYGCGDLPEEEAEAGKTLSSISVSPDSATLEIGGTQAFTVAAHYSNGTISLPTASWSVSGGIGTITSSGSSATFTATAEGSGTVEASYDGKSDTASVTVSAAIGPGGLVTIEVFPASVSLRVGGSETFTASGVDSSGEAIDISPDWQLSGDAIGVLSSAGLVATLEVDAEGTATVTAVSGAVSGLATVTVEGFVAEITVEADTYVDEDNAASSYGSDTSLKAGYVSGTAKHFEAYLRFSLTSIPSGANIESAVLMVYPSSAGSSALQLKALAGSFDNSTTWNAKPAIGSFIASGVYTSGDYNNISDEDLTSLVGDWVSGAATNYGLAILQEGTDDGTIVILSLENGSNPPMLRVEYTTP